MADNSIVPLGTGVTITDALQPNLGLLLDANQATYEIASGAGLHLLFIRADRTGPDTAWAFSLQSLPVEQVENIFKSIAEGGENNSPHWVDGNGYPVAMDTAWQSYTYPNTPNREYPPGPLPSQIETTAPDVVQAKQSGVTNVLSPIELEFDPGRMSLNKITEVGTHIFPLAYHRIVDGEPPRALVIQVARSDWHFWPMPTFPVWSKAPYIYRLGLSSSGV